MKKTLALILALLMILSIALVSCKKDPENPEEPTDDPWGDIENPDNSGSEGDGEGDGEGNNNQTSTNTYEDMNATMYVLHPVKVRGVDKKTTQNIVGTLKFGATVTVTGVNNTWYRVKLSDGNVGYVYDDFLTSDKTKVNVVMLDTPVETEIANVGLRNDNKTPASIRVRSTPWDSSNVDAPDYANINIMSELEAQVIDGFKVTKLGATEDGAWTYIKFTAKVNGADVTKWGYCASRFIKTEGTNADTPANPDVAPEVPAV